MNLNSPNLEEFKELIKNCDDENFNHIIWVTREGDVFINKFTTRNPSHKFEIANPNLLFWKGLFINGDRFVGEEAANDSIYIKNLIDELQKYWKSGYRGHIEK